MNQELLRAYREIDPEYADESTAVPNPEIIMRLMEEQPRLESVGYDKLAELGELTDMRLIRIVRIGRKKKPYAMQMLLSHLPCCSEYLTWIMEFAPESRERLTDALLDETRDVCTGSVVDKLALIARFSPTRFRAAADRLVSMDLPDEVYVTLGLQNPALYAELQEFVKHRTNKGKEVSSGS